MTENAAAVAVFAILGVLPLLFGGYVIYILPQYMLYGVLAMSLALMWGYAGILSFGQAAFFALGGYTMGLVMQAIGAPEAAYLGILVAATIGAALAALVGYFLFSAGVRDTYFVIVTLALSIMVEQIAVSQSQITGGWNGMFVDRMDLAFGPLGAVSLWDDWAIYYVVLPVVALVYGVLRWQIQGPFGKILAGIRENEDRMVALGFRTPLYKTVAFAVSGAMCGLAGALYATHASFVSPSLGGVLFSTEIVVWVAIAGRQSLLAALLGGIVVASLSNYLSSVAPEYWQLFLGLLFILAIVFFRGGVAGVFAQLGRPRGGE
ncbi:MAG: branched-chain amino acid ABC transporter permease [Rhodospirillaceae bacterium]|nr:branched-chain amino acid ABC transporter permease [Rhodospirillaceae bacterium]